jgi:hypothetical protein
VISVTAVEGTYGIIFKYSASIDIMMCPHFEFASCSNNIISQQAFADIYNEWNQSINQSMNERTNEWIESREVLEPCLRGGQSRRTDRVPISSTGEGFISEVDKVWMKLRLEGTIHLILESKTTSE